jgi:hypothetical protein
MLDMTRAAIKTGLDWRSAMRRFAILAITAACGGLVAAPALAQTAGEPQSIEESGQVVEPTPPSQPVPSNQAPPQYEPVQTFAPRIRGHWLLLVEPGPMNLDVHPVSVACGSYVFPLQLSEAFAVALSNALKGVFERVDDVAAPLAGEDLRRRGITGMIVVRGQELRPRLDVQTRFFSANMQTQVAILASVQADGHRGQLLNGTIRGEGIANIPEGLLCDGGSGRKSVAAAGELAVGDTVSKIVEALSTSQRVVASYTPPPPPKPVRRAAVKNQASDAISSRWPSPSGR